MSKLWVYLLDDFSGLDDHYVREQYRRLPLFRRKQCAGYLQDRDKRACILSYQLLVRGLREQYGLESSGKFIYNQHGKPYLKDYPHIFFNLSHCRTGIACALADIEIGVDIQDIRPYSIDVARRVCSDKELRELSLSGEPARLLCRQWTKKESYAKAEGISVASVLRQDLQGSWVVYRESGTYCMTLCCKGGQAAAGTGSSVSIIWAGAQGKDAAN